MGAHRQPGNSLGLYIRALTRHDHSLELLPSTGPAPGRMSGGRILKGRGAAINAVGTRPTREPLAQPLTRVGESVPGPADPVPTGVHRAGVGAQVVPGATLLEPAGRHGTTAGGQVVPGVANL